MPLFGDRSGSGFFNDLKTRLGFAPREDYDDEYDVYSDNFDDFSTYEDDDAAYDAYEGMGDRADDGFYYDEGYRAGYDDSNVQEPAGVRRPQSGQRNYGSLSLPNIYDVRSGVKRSERERLSNGSRIPYGMVIRRGPGRYMPLGALRMRATSAGSRLLRLPHTTMPNASRVPSRRGIPLCSIWHVPGPM